MIAATEGDTPIEAMRSCLRRGGVLAVPTESSYGLAADPEVEEGVELVYEIKARPRGQPLPVVAADLRQLQELGVDLSDNLVQRLATLWPAPLSLVLPLQDTFPAAAEDATLAVRVPACPPLLELLRKLGRPLTATSLNRSGEPAILDPAAATEFLAGYDALVMSGGRLEGGLPSTLVRVDAGAIEVLRRGKFPVEELAKKVGVPVK